MGSGTFTSTPATDGAYLKEERGSEGSWAGVRQGSITCRTGVRLFRISRRQNVALGVNKYLIQSMEVYMKVVGINGSPNKEGNTHAAISAVCEQLEKEGIACEIIHVGNKAVRGCVACHQCAKKRDEACALQGDDVNEWIQKIKEADGLILGSPVYFSAIAGTMKCFLDRAFFVASANGGMFRHKVGVSVVADRRAGGVPAYNQLNNYINYAEMFMPSSNYWNVAYGASSGEVLEDAEGMQILRVLGRNMAWLLKTKESSQFPLPEPERKILFNFIRP
jgi:multimeric flavodoxin WrbA